MGMIGKLILIIGFLAGSLGAPSPTLARDVTPGIATYTTTGVVESIHMDGAIVVIKIHFDSGATKTYNLMSSAKLRNYRNSPIHYSSVDPGDRVEVVHERVSASQSPFANVAKIIIQ